MSKRLGIRACVRCQVSHVRCHMSYLTCRLSPTPTATARDPPSAHSLTMISRLVCNDSKTNSKHKNHQNGKNPKTSRGMPILAIRSSPPGSRVSKRGQTDRHTNIETFRLNRPRGRFMKNPFDNIGFKVWKYCVAPLAGLAWGWDPSTTESSKESGACVQYCTILYCTGNHYIWLCCVVQYCTVQEITTIYCFALYSTELYCKSLHFTLLHCRVLYFTVNHYTLKCCTV